MTASMSRMALVCLVGCGAPTASAGGESSSGAETAATPTGASPSSGSSSSGSTTGAADSGTAAPSETTSASESSTGSVAQCQVEVLESLQLSPERFGALTLAAGDRSFVIVGSRGWTLAGSLEQPEVDRFLETDGDLLAGRFGPDGGWAYAQQGPESTFVHPLDDPSATYETPTGDGSNRLAGDLDDDGMDDLIALESGIVVLWRADGLGSFERLAESTDAYPPEPNFGFAPATDVAPAAVLVGQTDSGVTGLELVGDVLEKSYAVEVGFVWSMQGVPAPPRGGRAILVAREGGILIDPLDGYVGFLEGQAGEWTRRGIEFGILDVPPAAFDLDADGVLDAVAVTSGSNASLRGACSESDPLVSCLHAPLSSGAPESIAVRDDGVVFVATEDAGLWAHRLGECL